MFKKLLTLLCVLTFIGAAHAQSIWTDAPESGIPSAGERYIRPLKYRAIRIDVSAMKALLSTAPERFSPAAESGNLPVLSLPLPGGGVARFQLEETPVMHPELQAKYPNIRTYTGRGIDDPTAVLKCDLTQFGFHGMVISGQSGNFYIDPAILGNTEHYLVYYKKDYLGKKEDEPWTCATPTPEGAQELSHGPAHVPAATADYQGDTKLRRYRLALACTGEYAAFHGGTKVGALAGMNTTMNRVNGVYETDFAVTMQIIANNDAIIYLNAASDPYTNNDGGAMLGQNQTTCNNIIGVANYDIGHVFSTGGGGIAGLSVVCGTSKANGVTGGGSPIGDPFDIDYVAHEMGHQFGGNHTFGNCGGNVNNPAAVEPGSGTTIMAYAGICGGQNVASNSEDIFSGYSIQEMGNFIYSGGANTCPVKITTSNHNPVVDAGVNRTIPKSTPFALTAIGSDVDGDTLTYTWEQMDFGNAPSPPVSTATVGPLFRSYKGNSSPTRVFPRLPDLVANINSTWEELPGVARNMVFRVVARDHDWQAGCTDEDDIQLTVSAASGPFLVTAPNTNVTWFVGSTQTVTWDVANTTAAPVSCANVRITLSTDGGFTYPVVLAASVPNNGSATILVPNNISTTCRVRVESVGNIFFDISNTNFKIELPLIPTYLLGTSVSSLNICSGTTGSFTANLTSIAGFISAVTVDVTGGPAGAVIEITPNPVTPTGTIAVNISGITADMAGNYTLTVSGVGGSITQTATVDLTIFPGAPDVAVTGSPAHGATAIATNVNLSWPAAAFANTYTVEIATNPSFSAGSIVSTQTVSGTSAWATNLQIETVYYWRINATNDCGTGSYSPVAAFQTGGNLCAQIFNSTDVPKTIDQNTVNTTTSLLNVAASRAINDVNIGMDINHTYTGDLLAHLISPAGDTSLLFDQPGVPLDPYGCSGNNANLVFDSQAALDAATLEAQCNGVSPSLSGIFQPLESLNAYNGQNAAGDWKLLISDNFAEDGGALTAWTLSFCFPDSIAAGNLLVNSPLTVYIGQGDAILQTHLDMEISGIPEQASFVLLSLPAHGTLSLNGTPLSLGSTFTQADINNNLLTFTHNGDAASSDEFHFDALDQNNSAWIHDAVFVINIVPSNLAATAAQTADVLCAGGTNGQITVNATGLDGTYSYSLNGGASQNSNVFDGLTAGTYTVVVTGQFGFTATAGPITITEPVGISVSTSVFLDDLTVTASGGVGALEYSINGVTFQSSNEFLDLANGTYTVTVKDENGCTSTAVATVDISPLSVSLTTQSPISCAGNTNGEIIVNVNSGGQSPFTYSLNGGADQMSNVFSGLSAGTYTVVVTDVLGQSATTNGIVLIDPAAIDISANAVLNAISVTATGGTGALEYSIDGVNFQSGSQFNNVDNGTYTVTVQDENGCTATTTVTVFVTPLSGSTQTPPIACFGGTTTIFVNAANGISPYEYKLDNGAFQSSNSFPGISAGTYTVSVRDASGTTLLLPPVVIDQPTQVNVAVTVTGNDGTASMSGGTAPYSFTSDAPNPNLQDLPNGTYNVTATDANGCTATTSFTVNFTALNASFFITHLNCNGDTDGSVVINGFGGVPPYLFSFNGLPFSSINTYNNLAAGAYLVVVSDAEGALVNANIIVTEPPVLVVNATVAGPNISAVATGGTPDYVYSLNGAAPQSSGDFGNLAPGTYTVVATDANGCTDAITNLVVTSGVIEPSEVWGLSVAPNPSAGLFVLSLQNAPESLRVEIFDAQGRLLQSLNFTPNGGAFSTTLDLQDLPQGSYLLRLSDGQNWGGIRLSKIGY